MSRRLFLGRTDENTLLLSGLDEFLHGLVRQIPLAGTPGPASEGRLFPSPSRGRDAEADEEWREWVRPDLEGMFEENRSRVEGDLQRVRPGEGGGFELEIPLAHLSAWIHALNQARLALAATHGLAEAELSDELPVPQGKSLVLFQMHLYGLLQEWLLEAEE